jgi:hypothetical protein
MTIERLIKYCLQYLEQGSETDIMRTEMGELTEDDTFAEYVRNIEHSIYMGLTRYSSSNVLKIAEFEVSNKGGVVYLTDTKTLPKRNSDYTIIDGQTKTVTRPLFHKIKEIYAETKDGKILPSVEYFVIGNKVKIKNYNSNYKYYILYYPTINELEFYLNPDDLDIYGIELSELGVTDEMAINLKYHVYSELKLEENPSLANTNKNYFETYLSSLDTTQVFNNQTTLVDRMNPDVESEAYSGSYGVEWSDVYGD